jgi:hypothetical protein
MRSGLQAGTAGRGGGLGGEAKRCHQLLRGGTLMPEHKLWQEMNCQRYQMIEWEFNQREEGLGHQ